jgi:hypothetical protein
MRSRFLVVGLVGFLVLFGVWRGATAQEGSPAAGTPSAEATGAELVTLEPIAFGMAEELPPAPAVLQLVRLRIAPGGEFSQPDGDPGAALIVVEMGALTASLTRDAVVTRGLGGDKEPIAANQSFQMNAGDSVVASAGSGGTFRNEGTEEAVFLGAGIRPVETAAATPASG